MLEDSVDLGVLARGTPNFTGADLEAIINEAAILAVLENRKEVLIEDLEEARDKVRWGRQRRSRVMALEDKRITAFHESGHAVATTLLPEVEPLHKVTIIPRGMALGATMHLPEKDKYHVQRKELQGEIVALLAGRVAEEMFCADVSSGARDDIRRATTIARFMVREWGMSSKLGPIFYGEENSENGYEPVLIRPYSESTAVEIDAEVKAIINQCYERAQALLTKHRENIERVANALLEREVLDAADVDLLMSGGSLPDVKDVPSGAGGEEPPTGKIQEPPAVDEGSAGLSKGGDDRRAASSEKQSARDSLPGGRRRRTGDGACRHSPGRRQVDVRGRRVRDVEGRRSRPGPRAQDQGYNAIGRWRGGPGTRRVGRRRRGKLGNTLRHPQTPQAALERAL